MSLLLEPPSIVIDRDGTPQVSPAEPAADADGMPGTGRVDEALELMRLAAFGKMTGQFTHEIRNGLTGIRCFFDLLGAVELPAAVGGCLADVAEGLDRVALLTAQWMDVARAASASSCPNLEVQRIVTLLRASGVDRRTVLDVRLGDEVGASRVEARSLQSGLLVLFAELVDRGPREIRAITREEGARIVIRLEAEGEQRGPDERVDPARVGVALGGVVRRLALPHSGFELVLAARHESE